MKVFNEIIWNLTKAGFHILPVKCSFLRCSGMIQQWLKLLYVAWTYPETKVKTNEIVNLIIIVVVIMRSGLSQPSSSCKIAVKQIPLNRQNFLLVGLHTQSMTLSQTDRKIQ
jgi:hypothetical protein